MIDTTENHAEQEARAQYESICEMVAALECDYDRLQELREERGGLNAAINATKQDSVERENAERGLVAWSDRCANELAELENAAGDCESTDDAVERIHDDALSVEVRSDWYSAGGMPDYMGDEYRILLCTGGPAVQIRGELDAGAPCRAWLEHRDWGTPWTRFFGANQDTLLAYARCFYFGEG